MATTQYFSFGNKDDAEKARDYAEGIGAEVELDGWNQLAFDSAAPLTQEQIDALMSHSPYTWSFE